MTKPVLQGNFTSGGLPRGPHGLTREEVEADQRQRLVQAMIDEVARRGYESTTVEHLIKRAGVSRKTFYAHFQSREELLLVAFDTTSASMLKLVHQASMRTGGSTRQLEASMRRLCRGARERTGGIELCTIDVAAAGPAGLTRRKELMHAYGKIIQRCLGDVQDSALSPAMAATLAGTVHRVIDSRLRAKHEEELADLALALARWIRSYHPAPPTLIRSQSHSPAGSWQNGDNGHHGGRAPGTLTLTPLHYIPPTAHKIRGLQAHANREKILDAVARITSQEGYASLNALAIARAADLPERAFLAQFADKDDAFIAAFELGHIKAQAIIARAHETAPTWRAGVIAGVKGLLDFLASEPLYTHMAFISAPLAGPQMAIRTHQHAAAYGRLLLTGAPQRRRPPAIAAEAIAQTIFELAFTLAANGRTSKLASVAEPVTYLALAPYLGAGEAAKIAA